MKNLCIILICSALVPLQAQIENPVSWSFDSKPTADDHFQVIVKATIEEGWHLYSQFMDEGGPIPTSIHFEENTDITLKGNAEEIGEKESGYDELFDMEVAYFSNAVTFEQELTANKLPTTVTGYVEFMVCDDEKCLPPDQVSFSLALTSSNQPKEAPSQKDSPQEKPQKNQPPDINDLQGNKDESPSKVEAPVINPPVIHDPKIPSSIGSSDLVKGQTGRQILQPVQWFISYDMADNQYVDVYLKAKIAVGWKIYGMELDGMGPIPTSIQFEKGSFTMIGKTKEHIAPVSKYDAFFEKEVPYFVEEAIFVQRFQYADPSNKIDGNIEFMACDSTKCLPPEQLGFSLNLSKFAKGEEVEIVANGESQDPPAINIEHGDGLMINDFNLDNPVSDCGGEVIGKSNFQFWQVFLLGILGGFIALLTPCVFPMIPLTVSFFTNRDKKQGLKNAWLYGLSIFSIYVLFSLPFHFLEAVSPEIFNTISTSIWLNLIFFVVFVAFALSFFGFFEITLPASWTNKANSASSVGGFIGVFFMALTLALVSFSCTGPILGTLLASAGSFAAGSNNAVLLSSGMAGFGLALALPFGLFAAFPRFLDSLPKSGNWMTSLKVVLGFVELALAIKFLSNADLVGHWGLLKREIFIGLWAVIGIGLALYLFGKIRFPHDTPMKKLPMSRIIGGLAVILFVIYLIPGILPSQGGKLSLLSGFPPPEFYSIYEQESECPLNLPCFKDYEQGIEHASKVNKPVMLDFTGWACVNCRKMEENVWSNPEIYQRLKDEFVIISLYVDDRQELPEDRQREIELPNGQRKKIRTIGNLWATFQTQNFLNNSQPYYAILNPEQERLLNYPVGYTPDADKFQQFLDCGLSTHKQLARR